MIDGQQETHERKELHTTKERTDDEMKQLKRLLCLLLVAVLVFGAIPIAHASAVDNFTDISSYMPSYEHILRYIVEGKGDMTGTSSTTFSPATSIKRCDAMVALCRVWC